MGTTDNAAGYISGRTTSRLEELGHGERRLLGWPHRRSPRGQRGTFRQMGANPRREIRTKLSHGLCAVVPCLVDHVNIGFVINGEFIARMQRRSIDERSDLP